MADQVTPEIGMGATSGYGADCYPHTIIAISKSGKEITVQADLHHPIAEGFDYYSNQKYTYTPDPNGSTRVYTLRKNGRWILKGESLKNGGRLGIGHRRYYQDPSF